MLRARLFLNLLPFVVILLAVGAYAVVLFSRLAEGVDVKVRDDYESITAAQTMSFELSRMDRGVILSMEWGNKAGNAIFEENRKLFEEKLRRLQLRTDIPQGAAINQELTTNYLSFQKSANAIFDLHQRDQQHRVYNDQFYPSLIALNTSLEKARRLHRAAILATNQSAEYVTRHVTHLMVLGIAVALLISSCACYQMARSILRPIGLLTAATRAVGEGNLDPPVPVISRDELGTLAESFNKMAAQLRVYRESTTERIVRMHRTVESTVTSIPDPVFVLNKNGQIDLANPAAEELAKMFPLPKELPEPLKPVAQRVLESGENYRADKYKEAVCFRAGDEEKHFLPRIVAMRNGDGSLFGVVVVLHDVTRLRLLDAVKTNLVATVSHELKTPLTSLRMALHLLLERPAELTAKQQEMAVTARDEAERMLRILNDLLDLARLEEGNIELQREPTTPAALVQEVMEELSPLVVEKGLKLNWAVAPDLPAIRVDHRRIRLVFNNLISNAIKHSPPGAEILLRSVRSGDHGVQFSVVDRGPGVPKEYQQRIFDRFFRVPGQTPGGAGLGLSIAKEVVIAHGGRIGVKSRTGQGSEFYVVPPSVEEDDLADAKTVPEESTRTPAEILPVS